MTDRHAEALRKLEARLRTGPGELSPQTRAAAIDADPLPDPLAQGYVETLRVHAYKLTDRSLQELAQAGWTDDQVFELTVAGAFGAAKRRLDAGLRALGEAVGGPAHRLGRDEDAAGSHQARQPLAELPVHPAGRQAGQDGPAGCGPDAELPLRVLWRALFGVAPVGDARAVGVDGRRARAVGRLHLVSEPVPLLNGGPRRGRVDGAGRRDHPSGVRRPRDGADPTEAQGRPRAGPQAHAVAREGRPPTTSGRPWMPA